MAISGDNFPTIFDDNFKTSVISFSYIKFEFWSSFDIMSGSEGKGILFLQLVVLFKMKKKKRRKRKKWERELFRKREEKGAFNNLIQKMKLADRESFFREELIRLVNIWFICDLFDFFNSFFFLLKHFFKFWNAALAWSTKDKNLKEF